MNRPLPAKRGGPLALALCFSLLLPAAAQAQNGAFRADYLKTSPHFKRAFRQVIGPIRQSTVLVLSGSTSRTDLARVSVLLVQAGARGALTRPRA